MTREALVSSSPNAGYPDLLTKWLEESADRPAACCRMACRCAGASGSAHWWRGHCNGVIWLPEELRSEGHPMTFCARYLRLEPSDFQVSWPRQWAEQTFTRFGGESLLADGRLLFIIEPRGLAFDRYFSGELPRWPSHQDHGDGGHCGA